MPQSLHVLALRNKTFRRTVDLVMTVVLSCYSPNIFGVSKPMTKAPGASLWGCASSCPFSFLPACWLSPKALVFLLLTSGWSFVSRLEQEKIPDPWTVQAVGKCIIAVQQMLWNKMFSHHNKKNILEMCCDLGYVMGVHYILVLLWGLL